MASYGPAGLIGAGRVRRRNTAARPANSLGADATLAAVARRHIQLVLKRHGGNVTAAAGVLGLHRRSLQRKIIRYGLGSAREGGSVSAGRLGTDA